MEYILTSMQTPGMKDSSAEEYLQCPHEGKKPYSSQELKTEWEMGGSLFLRTMSHVQVKSVHWLPPFLARCIKTKKKTPKLVHCPPDKEHPVNWNHSTSGGLMLLLSNA